MRLPEPRLREVQVHNDELTVRRRPLDDQLEFALHGLAVLRQVQDELALTVHVDVDRVCLRVDTETVVPVLLADILGDHPLEVVFVQTREREGNHNGLLVLAVLGVETENRQVRSLLHLVHLDLLFQVAPSSDVLSGTDIIAPLYADVNSKKSLILRVAMEGSLILTEFNTLHSAFATINYLVHILSPCCCIVR